MHRYTGQPRGFLIFAQAKLAGANTFKQIHAKHLRLVHPCDIWDGTPAIEMLQILLRFP